MMALTMGLRAGHTSSPPVAGDAVEEPSRPPGRCARGRLRRADRAPAGQAAPETPGRRSRSPSPRSSTGPRRVAAQAAQAVERVHRAFHVAVRQALWEFPIGLLALQPRHHGDDLLLVRLAVDGEVAQQGHVAQGLDDHDGLGRLPAGEDLAAVHAHGTGAALLDARQYQR